MFLPDRCCRVVLCCTVAALAVSCRSPTPEDAPAATVHVLPDQVDYQPVGRTDQAHAPALHTSSYGSFFAAADANRPVAVLYDTNLVLVRMLATHSALHQYVDHAFSRPLPA